MRCSETLVLQPPHLHFCSLLTLLMLQKLYTRVFQSKYKKDMEDLPNSLYSQLPETLQSQFMKEMAEKHSQVKLSN